MGDAMQALLAMAQVFGKMSNAPTVAAPPTLGNVQAVAAEGRVEAEADTPQNFEEVDFSEQELEEARQLAMANVNASFQ
jgi:hypothetical protein